MIIITDRERDVLILLCRGYKNEEIAEKLNISVHTVKAHLESIYEKFGVYNRVQAAMKAVQAGIVNLETAVA